MLHKTDLLILQFRQTGVHQCRDLTDFILHLVRHSATLSFQPKHRT